MNSEFRKYGLSVWFEFEPFINTPKLGILSISNYLDLETRMLFEGTMQHVHCTVFEV